VPTSGSSSVIARMDGTRSGSSRHASSCWPRSSSASGSRAPAEPRSSLARSQASASSPPDWLEARKLNPAIKANTIAYNETQLTRYLAPFFGELRPSENHGGQDQGVPPPDPRRERPDPQVGRERCSAQGPTDGPADTNALQHRDNKTLRTLAQVLDEAEDAGWIDRNAARSKPRSRETPAERRGPRGVLDVGEFLDLLDGPETLTGDTSRRRIEKAAWVRELRERDQSLDWEGDPDATSASLPDHPRSTCTRARTTAIRCGPPSAVIATLGSPGCVSASCGQLNTRGAST